MRYRILLSITGLTMAIAARPAPAALSAPNICAALNGEVVTVEGTMNQRSFDHAQDRYSFVLSQPSMCGATAHQITVYGKGRPPCDDGRRARVTGRFSYVENAGRAPTGNLMFANVVSCY